MPAMEDVPCGGHFSALAIFSAQVARSLFMRSLAVQAWQQLHSKLVSSAQEELNHMRYSMNGTGSVTVLIDNTASIFESGGYPAQLLILNFETFDWTIFHIY
jgi:hypothetical protein